MVMCKGQMACGDCLVGGNVEGGGYEFGRDGGVGETGDGMVEGWR